MHKLNLPYKTTLRPQQYNMRTRICQLPIKWWVGVVSRLNFVLRMTSDLTRQASFVSRCKNGHNDPFWHSSNSLFRHICINLRIDILTILELGPSLIRTLRIFVYLPFLYAYSSLFPLEFQFKEFQSVQDLQMFNTIQGNARDTSMSHPNHTTHMHVWEVHNKCQGPTKDPHVCERSVVEV